MSSVAHAQLPQCSFVPQACGDILASAELKIQYKSQAQSLHWACTKHEAPAEVCWQSWDAKADYVAKENTKVDENLWEWNKGAMATCRGKFSCVNRGHVDRPESSRNKVKSTVNWMWISLEKNTTWCDSAGPGSCSACEQFLCRSHNTSNTKLFSSLKHMLHSWSICLWYITLWNLYWPQPQTILTWLFWVHTCCLVSSTTRGFPIW